MWHSPCNKARISFALPPSLHIAFIFICFPKREYISFQGGGIIKVTHSLQDRETISRVSHTASLAIWDLCWIGTWELEWLSKLLTYTRCCWPFCARHSHATQRIESTCTVSTYETDIVFDSLLNQCEITEIRPLIDLYGNSFVYSVPRTDFRKTTRRSDDTIQCEEINS